MTSPPQFALEFAHLVALLRGAPDALDDQEATLPGMHAAIAGGDVTVSLAGHGLTANGGALPEQNSEPALLADRMRTHGIIEARFYSDVSREDLLACARRLASDEVTGSLMSLLTMEGIRLIAAPAADARLTPASIAAVKPFLTSASVGDTFKSLATSLATPDQANAGSTGKKSGSPIERSDGMFVHAAAVADERTLTVDELFVRLQSATTAKRATQALDELATRLEQGVRRGRPELITEILLEVVRRESELKDQECRIAFVVAVRRMSAPSHLRVAAELLPRRVELRDGIMAVLARAGEEGADAVIEQLIAARPTADRRVYFNALVKLQAGLPSLMHMLGDSRWYVVRNAAELIGEIGATTADTALLAALVHPDGRVRRSAMLALGKLATPAARQALEEELKAPQAERRALAATAIAQIPGARSGAVLCRALEDESDTTVQHSVIASLGRLATRDAVEALVVAASPRRKLFRKRAPAYRVAATHALADAGTPRALATLERLRDDDDSEVREAARRVSSPPVEDDPRG